MLLINEHPISVTWLLMVFIAEPFRLNTEFPIKLLIDMYSEALFPLMQPLVFLSNCDLEISSVESWAFKQVLLFLLNIEFSSSRKEFTALIINDWSLSDWKSVKLQESMEIPLVLMKCSMSEGNCPEKSQFLIFTG